MSNPIRGFRRGFTAFFRGCQWLKRHPLALLLLFVPMILGLLSVVSFWGLLGWQHDYLTAWILPAEPQSWGWLILYYALKGLLYIALISVGLLFYGLVVNIVAAPLYDYVSMQVERELAPGQEVHLNLRQSLIMIKEEMKKFLFIVVLNLVVLLIPGVNALAPLVAAICLGWDLYDYPLARRGLSFRERIRWVIGRVPTLAGLGVWLLIPGLQFILLPLAIPAGSMLAVEDRLLATAMPRP